MVQLRDLAKMLMPKKGFLTSFLQSLIAIAIGFSAGAIMISIAGYSVVESYSAMFQGAFGGSYEIATTLARSTPLIFTGLAFAIAIWVAAFNIGAEGQLYAGAFSAFLVGYLIELPAPIHLPLCLIAAMVGGGFLGYIPGVLKVKRGAHEVVTTIMLNWIMLWLTDYLVAHPFNDPTGSLNQTWPIKPSAAIPKLLSGTRLYYTIFIALICSIALYFIFERTKLGYEMRAVGLNPRASEFGGISPSRTFVTAMTLSGAVAGLAGAGMVLGTYGRVIERFSPGHGFDGIAVALIGRNHPIGAIFGAVFIGFLYTGSLQMRLITHMPKELVVAIEGIIIIFAAIPQIIALTRTYLRRRRERA